MIKIVSPFLILVEFVSITNLKDGENGDVLSSFLCSFTSGDPYNKEKDLNLDEGDHHLKKSHKEKDFRGGQEETRHGLMSVDSFMYEDSLWMDPSENNGV